MVLKQVQCPQCQNIISISGNPGEIQKISCPQCHTTGKVTFQQIIQPKNSAITVSNLRKEYGNLIAVNNISFTVKKGEVFAFLGPNGAGKTTTVEMIESIRKPSNGTIKLFNHDISTSFHQVKNKIGILPQEFHSFERLTIRETLHYFASIFDHQANIDDIIKAMNLTDDEHKLYKELSGGLKQRVGVAISLVNDPDIIFLDEPTTGLDPKARREVWEVIANLREKGKTVFLTTHYMEEAEYLADHIAIIHQGNIIAEGTLHELISRYGKGSILKLTNSDFTQIKQALQPAGFEVKKTNHHSVLVTIEYKDQILEVLSILKKNAIDYDRIDIHRPNLEELFLQLTGARLQEVNT
ncbi:MAG: ABC transporter ATP-binding protein [Thermoplasmatota archaeon]